MLPAKAVGLGSANLKHIEVLGISVEKAVFDFDAYRIGRSG
jgi:hypothetical protein